MFVVNTSLPRVLQTIQLASSSAFIDIVTITNSLETLLMVLNWYNVDTFYSGNRQVDIVLQQDFYFVCQRRNNDTLAVTS